MTSEPAPISPGVSRATAALARLRESGLLDRHLGRAEQPPAETQAITTAEEQASAEPMLLTFRTGERMWAAPSSALLEVVSKPDVVPLPGAPAHLCGVMVFRGDVLPVFDLVRILALHAGGAPIDPPSRATCAVVFAGEGLHSPLALAADRVEDVLPAADALSDSREEPRAATDPLIVGRTTSGAELLDAAALLSDPRLTVGEIGSVGGEAKHE